MNGMNFYIVREFSFCFLPIPAVKDKIQNPFVLVFPRYHEERCRFTRARSGVYLNDPSTSV
jgi:hypothetical protein